MNGILIALEVTQIWETIFLFSGINWNFVGLYFIYQRVCIRSQGYISEKVNSIKVYDSSMCKHEWYFTLQFPTFAGLFYFDTDVILWGKTCNSGRICNPQSKLNHTDIKFFPLHITFIICVFTVPLWICSKPQGIIFYLLDYPTH